MIKIYGIVGYTILYDSNIFPNTEILLIADMHTEPQKNCAPHNQIDIDKLLELYLKKDYTIFLEEIPNNKELVFIFPESSHVNNTRELYLKNMDKIIAFDIRLDLIDLTELTELTDLNYFKDYEKPIIKKLKLLNDFITLKSELYSNKFVKKYYKKILLKFRKFITKYDHILCEKKNININKSQYNSMITELSDLLSDFIELYCFYKLCIELETKKGKFVINCGLYHSENLLNYIKLYLNYKEKQSEGINYLNEILYDNPDQCIMYFDF